MAVKFKIEIFREKNQNDLTLAFAEENSLLEAGSSAASVAAMAAAFLLRACSRADGSKMASERLEYIKRNGEILRNYMVNLVDEDVKSRAPLRRALKEENATATEASMMPAIAIPEEISGMMMKNLEFLQELLPVVDKHGLQYIGTSAELAVASVRIVQPYLAEAADRLTDDITRYVVRKENLVTLGECEEKYSEIIAVVNASFHE